MIHACGMVDLVADVASSPGFCAAARGALRAGKPILCDTAMVASGVTRARLPADNEVVCTLSHPDVAGARRRARHDAHAPRPWSCGARSSRGAVVVVGNAPTALFRLLELVEDGADRPAAVIGVPVGFIGAAESKAELARHPAGARAPRRARPARRQRHRRRRRERARERRRVSAMTTHGRLFGIGVGPGDPELLTRQGAAA